jgi:hypothetical protein
MDAKGWLYSEQDSNLRSFELVPETSALDRSAI